jgi:serine/threonine-protein kinase
MLACPECRKLYPSDAIECTEHRRALVPLESLPDDLPLEPGAMVGEFRIERKLGSGTFGAVYAGEQPLIGKKVAVKVLHKRLVSNAGVVSRFVAEARAVNKIRHKNIIDIFSFGMLEDKQPYFVMELLDGMTLRELLDREKRLGVAEAIPVLRGIAAGLDAAHEAGVTHRDLKPDNIFLAIEKDGSYFPKVLDFGVAKLIDDDIAHKTATGAAIGTPSYMAPEQCRGKRVDHRADVYALGVVIHEMLTGQRLFQADSAMDVLLKHVSEPPRPMSEVAPELPEELDAPVLAMLAKDPNKRPDSAGAAVAALAERARAIGADREDADAPKSSMRFRASAEPAPLPQTPARREAPTVATEGPRVAAALTSPSEGAPAEPASDDDPSLQSTGDTSSPVVISVGDAQKADDAASPALPIPVTTSDGRFAISTKGNTIKVWDLRTGRAVHTFPGKAGGDPNATGTLIPGGAGGSAARARSGGGAKRGLRVPAWALVAVGALILAALALLLRERAAPSTARPPSATADVIVRLAVTPPDADLFLDGVRVGPASTPLVLPRSDRRRALRLEKRGFEAETLWIVPDRDTDLPPITLHPSPASALDPARPGTAP